jgi:hypothetical protein
VLSLWRVPARSGCDVALERWADDLLAWTVCLGLDAAPPAGRARIEIRRVSLPGTGGMMASSPQHKQSSTENVWTLEFFDEITNLLAEALFQDFQEHRRATVQSPQGIDHRISLTDAEKKTRDAQVD